MQQQLLVAVAHAAASRPCHPAGRAVLVLLGPWVWQAYPHTTPTHLQHQWGPSCAMPCRPWGSCLSSSQVFLAHSWALHCTWAPTRITIMLLLLRLVLVLTEAWAGVWGRPGGLCPRWQEECSHRSSLGLRLLQDSVGSAAALQGT